MWLGSSHLFSYKCMYAGGVNVTSLLFMNVHRIYIFIACFSFAPLLKNWQKGEKYLESLYACLSYFLIYVKRGKDFDEFMHVYFHMYAYMCCLVYALHWISICLCYAWVKGELLWSLTLILAYITSWVLSSSKRGRLLAQRPTLVLMMINSCSYSLLIILWCLVSDT